ncbi:MAG TPA: cupin domain-containing protein [Dehalococcoidia bacterium]|nr:cupin domain-containing protein [Dehalococcoidia bacterium]
MDVPDIESQIRRAFGSRAGARPFGTIEWIADRGPASAEMSAALAVFDPDSSNAEHVHPNSEELIYVLEGEIEHTLGDQSTILRAGDLFVAPRHVPHRLVNRSGAPCRMLIVFPTAAREFVETGRS